MDSSWDNVAHYNNILNNIEYGINASNNNGYTINAQNNWWGDDTGPFHSSENIGGKGDNVTDNVLFDPWLDEYGNIYEKDKDGNEEEDDDNNKWVLFLLIFILIILSVLLSAVIIFLFIDQKPKDGLKS